MANALESGEIKEQTQQMVEGFIDKFFTACYVERREYDFEAFVKENPQYEAVVSKLEEIAESCGKRLGETMLGFLSESQCRTVGAHFAGERDAKSIGSGEAISKQLADYIRNSPEFQDYLKVAVHFSSANGAGAEVKQLLENIAKMIYDKLDENQRAKCPERIFNRQVLNLGIISLTRNGSYKASAEVLIKYPALFEKLPEVRDRIIQRYIAEEVTNCTDRSQEALENLAIRLKDEVRRMYGK